MATRIVRYFRNLLVLTVLGLVAACSTPEPSGAAPQAMMLMDARTGEVLYEKNADARLHPASLTKMMTLYITFQAIERGEISLDTMVTISKHAASEPPSRLGLKPGQKIALRYLIRAAAIKSANDAATAIGEAVGGSEAKFAARMNATAKAIGMTGSTFKNANGLTTPGHLSTARDLTLLGRRLFYDYPQYYNIFSRRETDAGMADVRSTNRRFLDAYKGADGIKTGFTNAAGFNLTASAERGGVRLVATILGGASTADRNAKMAKLLDLGFSQAPANAAVRRPPAPVDIPVTEDLLVSNGGGAPAKTIRLQLAVASSARPRARPAPQDAAATEVAVAAMQDSIAGALAEATGAPAGAASDVVVAASNEAVAVAEATVTPVQAASVAGLPFAMADAGTMKAASPASPRAVAAPPPPKAPNVIHTATPVPNPDMAEMVIASAEPARPTEGEVVMRISTSGGRFWGVNIGRFDSRASADRALMQTMLSESATLNDGLRKIVERGGGGYDANFMGLSQDQADLACRRLQARGTQCFAIGP